MIGGIFRWTTPCLRLLGVHQHEQDPASLSSAIDPCMIGGLLDDRIAGLQMDGGVVEHHVDVSLFPNWIGDVQKRFVDLVGDELVLASPLITDATGTSVTPRLRWRRIT